MLSRGTVHHFINNCYGLWTCWCVHLYPAIFAKLVLLW